jgi:hypothetical protein
MKCYGPHSHYKQDKKKRAEAVTRTQIGRTIAQHANHWATENCWQNEFTTRHMKLQGKTRKIKSRIPHKRWSVDN